MLFELTRLRLSAMVAASALAGYLIAPGSPALSGALPTLLGVLLLASGASALNQVQEWRVDRAMERTRQRPIPSGRLTPLAGLLIALSLITLAFPFLLHPPDHRVALLGLFALLWYNGLYTPLKRHTSMAVLPGSLCGAIPPLMGWVAGGGPPGDYRIGLLCGLFFLWQIPHFWLLTLKAPHDQEKAGLPSLLQRLSTTRLLRLLRLWSLALATATLLFFALVPLAHPLSRFLAAAPVLLSLLGLPSHRDGLAPLGGLSFRNLTLFPLSLLAILLLDRAFFLP